MVQDELLPPSATPESARRPLTPTQIFLRGLAVSLPAILTIVIVVWIIQFINDKLIEPATWAVKYVVASVVDESLPAASPKLKHLDAAPPLDHCGSTYLVTTALREDYFRYIGSLKAEQSARNGDMEAPPDWNPSQQLRSDWMQRKAYEVPAEVFVPLGPRAVPYNVYAEVARSLPPGQVPSSAAAVYREYVSVQRLWSVVPLSVATVLVVVVLLYFMGRFVSIRVGRWFVGKFEEQVLGRLPVVRNVYGSVKQVTDFVFTENQPVEYRRVVAVEYPRKGIWSIGFVTGESFVDLAVATGEPCVAVLIPTSPMPMTGFTINVPRSGVLDVDLTVEQAMQFCISCGVLTPPHQRLTRETQQRLTRTGVLRDGGDEPSASENPPRSTPSVPSGDSR